MSGDRAAARWLHRQTDPEEEQGAPTLREEDDSAFSARGEAAWLPVLTVDDRVLVREYMLASEYPQTAVDSVDNWPFGELRHLLENARSWKARQSVAAERAETERHLHELEERRTHNHAVLERIYHDQATAIVARDCDKSIMLLTAREARRTRTTFRATLVSISNDISVTHPPIAALLPGHRTGTGRASASSSTCTTAPPKPGGIVVRPTGQVPVPPRGSALVSKRSYRALYPFQRAALNAAFLNRQLEIAPAAQDSPPARTTDAAARVQAQ